MNRQAKQQKKSNILLKKLLTIFLAVMFLFGVFNIYYTNKIFPNTYINGINMSGKSKEDAELFIKNTFSNPEKLILKGNGDTFEMDLIELGFEYDSYKTTATAFSQFRSGKYIKDLFERIQGMFTKKDVDLVIKFNDMKLSEFIDVLSAKIDTKPVYPSVVYGNNKIIVNQGKNGKIVDRFLLKNSIIDQLLYYNFSPIDIPIKIEKTEITQEEMNLLEKRGTNFIGKSISINHESDIFLIDDTKLLSFLDNNESYKESAILNFVESELTPKINRQPQDAIFKEEKGKVVEFLPGINGAIVDPKDLTNKIGATLTSLENSDQKNATITAVSQLTHPKVSTSEVNNLGIKELLGTGKSNFKGSIPGRIHNVNHASQILNGVLVSPGEIVSFNKILGDISKLTGYKQAYIIKDGKTVLGDGGGVCQTSTTLFRAVLSAGLPIIERRAHAYRVGYYEQGFPPGIDATVFSPTTDFKFKNDTAGHILIQTTVDLKNLTLTYELYGSSDGRVSRVSKPVITSQIAPPEDLYIDDPTLPAGKIEQTEHKAWGAKVVFDYKVERSKEMIFEKTFVSNYRPWGAVYLRGTATTQN